MKTLTKYHRASGAIIGHSVLPDESIYDPSTEDIGVFHEAADPETQFVTADGTLGVRQSAALTVDKSLVGIGEAATITCPNPCWLRVNGAFVQAAGTHAVISSEPARITVMLAGAYRAPTITVTVGDAIETAFAADPRWQALQNATPAQIDNWLSANVTTVAQARQVLRFLILAVRRLAQE